MSRSTTSSAASLPSRGATDAQLSILDDLIQSKRKQVGQYHELAEIAQEALDMMQLDYEFVYPKKRIYLK